jgi:predicted DNA-binding transcriptional regulator AlpA
MNAADVSEYLGITRQRVYQLALTLDFPEPVDTWFSHEWEREAIEEWAAQAWWNTKPWRVPPVRAHRR